MTDNYHFCVGKPRIFNEPLFKRRVEDILYTKWFSNNATYVTQLENSLKELYEYKYAIAVVNATLGLEICLAYLKTKTSNTQIVLPSFTFVATAAAVVRAGFTPVFCDIKNDFTFDLDELDNKITNKTAGIIPCDLFGNINAVDALSKYNGLFVLYDLAHALNCMDDLSTKYVGNFGDAGVFSLHPSKLAGALEAGIIATNNKDIAEFAIQYRNFGFGLNKGPQGEVVSIGTNAKMNEISAAAALTQIENIEEIQTHYYSNYQTYKENLPSSVILCEPNVYFSNFSYVVIRTKERDKILAHLQDNGILARTYFQPIHLMEPYRSYCKAKDKLPMTELLASEVLSLPTGPCVYPEDIVYICNVIAGVK